MRIIINKKMNIIIVNIFKQKMKFNQKKQIIMRIIINKKMNMMIVNIKNKKTY